MKTLNLKDVSRYVEKNIGVFHQKRISGLNNLKLIKVLSKKNPYLFKAKYILTAQDIIKSLTDAYISSQEETIFGDWLEGLAIFINEKVYKGRKSGIPGIDLEFDKEKIRYIITIKSGPNWGNSSQVKKLIEDFDRAKRTLRTSNSKLNVVAVNGCCYGRENKSDKGSYFKYCGQKFWQFISGDKELYIKIIKPLGFKAKERNDDFIQSYSQMINKFTKEFADTFCKNDGSVDWDKFVQFNSAEILPKK
ncbi:MAG TPA: PmeII family type II restriction endonuclease [Ignavibacteria bacterium]|nr:PmeII family type II restriction endonuclease [Ignavibacteria bacterium]